MSPNTVNTNGQQAPVPDKYQRLVDNAVNAFRGDSKLKLQWAFTSLLRIPVSDLLAEMCICIEEAIAGQDIDDLLAAADEEPRAQAKALIVAVENNDLKALHTHSGGDLLTLVNSLLSLTADLRDARERISASR